MLMVNSINQRQHQVKETTRKSQPHVLNQALLTLQILHYKTIKHVY